MNSQQGYRLLLVGGKYITEEEYAELLSLIGGNKNYVVIELSTGSAIFTKNSIETLVVYHDN